MRSMKSAGIGWRPPFVKAEVIDDRPFEIITAEARRSRFEADRSEIVVQARLLTTSPGYQPLYDANGDLIEAFSWSAALSGQRHDIVSHFARFPNETLGPVMFCWIDTDNGTGNAFVSIEDYVGEMPQPRAAARPAPEPRDLVRGMATPPLTRETPRSQIAGNFRPNRAGAAAPSANGRGTAGRPAPSTRNVYGQVVPDDEPIDWPDATDPE